MADTTITNNDFGIKLVCTMSADVTGLSVELKYKKPDGIEGAWPANIDTAATGVISYTLVSGDIDKTGTWKIWGHATGSGIDIESPSPFELRVINN